MFLSLFLQVIQNGGQLVVLRRPPTAVKPEDYLPCEFCYGFVRRINISAHVRKCLLKPKYEEAHSANYARNGVMLLMPVLSAAMTEDSEKADVDELFDKMRENAENPGLYNVCSNDELIREFALALVIKMGPEEDRRETDMDNARTKVRGLGRLLKVLNEDEMGVWKDINYFITGKHFRKVAKGVRKLALSADSPQLALKCRALCQAGCYAESNSGHRSI